MADRAVTGDMPEGHTRTTVISVVCVGRPPHQTHPSVDCGDIYVWMENNRPRVSGQGELLLYDSPVDPSEAYGDENHPPTRPEIWNLGRHRYVYRCSRCDLKADMRDETLLQLGAGLWATGVSSISLAALVRTIT